MDNYHSFLPKLGHTRCYWALLSADLQFIYLDPVLTYHLDAQADLLVGKSLLSFVHPDEQASAKTDLRSVLESRTLHGSVTRVRFSRLSKVRRQLGHQGPLPPWSDAEKIAVDANYMAVDIVINWAAEGLVLCFVHATVDLDPRSDNDELHKSHWTNWCGTPLMPADQIQLLFRRLLICVPQSPSSSHTRIFQILANQPGRQLLLSWPPDQGNGPTGREFAKLVENAEMGSGTQKGNDAKTSCTRRYRATQLMSPSFGEVESIFIPHGSVIFACHKVESSIRSTPAAPTNMQHHLSYNTNNGSGYPPPPNPSYYDSSPPYPPLVPPYNHGYLSHQPLPPPPSHAYPPRWSPAQQQNYLPPPPSSTQQWSTPSPTHPVSPVQPPSTSVAMDNSNLRSASYSSAPGPSWQPSPGSYEVYRTVSPTYGSYPGAPRTNAAASGTNKGALPAASALLNTSTAVRDIVPPPKRRVSPGTGRGGDQHNAQATGSSSGRGSGNRPMGIQQCSSCGATTSPEWRKGPSGKKELCNACGLRYARSRAKKDGGPPAQTHSRKKKTDKADDRHHVVGGNRGGGGVEAKKEMRQRDREIAGGTMTPPIATIAAAGGSSGYASTIMRRSFGSGSEYGAPGTSPGGSISGSEGGSHGHAHYAILATGGGGASSGANRDGSVLTPSPSPPASTSVTSTSGSLALPLPIPSPIAPTHTSAYPQPETASHDVGFVHYNPASHERSIPPLTVHSHSPHTTQPSHPHSPHSTLSPGGHYVHSAYTARPSPLSQAGNIVTGPAAGPLTPLSALHPTKEGDAAVGGAGAGNAMQLPPLAYMDRVAGSNQTNDHDHRPLGMGAKPEYGGEGSSHNNGNGNAMQGSVGGGGGPGGGVAGREPLTPLSAESPIGPGVAGGSHGRNGRGGRRSILSGQ